MTTITISLNDELAQQIKTEMQRKKFDNKSEFFRSVLRLYFFPEDKKEPIIIEPIYTGDPDYKYVKRTKRNKSKYIPLATIEQKMH